MMTVTRLLALFAIVAACGSPAVSPSPTTSTVAAATSLSATKPPDQQRTLPLPTTTRWAIDKGSSNDPHRSLLVLFYDGNAQDWRVVDASGADVFRVPIQGSGIHGPETCVVTARRPGEGATWVALDSVTVDRFLQLYRGYRAVAAGIPTGSATLEMVDSGCRRT